MRATFIIIIIANLILISCTKSGNTGSLSTLKVTVTYQKDFGTDVDTAVRHIDVGAKVFLYKNLDPVHDVLHANHPSYTADGAITLNNGSTRMPDTSAVITESGAINFSSLPSQTIAVLALSKYYPGQGRLTSTVFGSDGFTSKLISLNFYPNTWPK